MGLARRTFTLSRPNSIEFHRDVVQAAGNRGSGVTLENTARDL